MTIRVVLGDDNVLVREGVRALLSVTDGIEVVGVAEDAPTLLAAAAEHLPDVVVDCFTFSASMNETRSQYRFTTLVTVAITWFLNVRSEILTLFLATRM